MTMTRAGDGLPVKSPSEVGMSGNRLGAIERVIERGIKAGGYPGASVIVGRKGAAVFEKGFGRLSWSTSSTAVDAQRTIYDVASLSKVVGTTTAIMILFDEKKIGLDDPVVNYIPTFGGGDKDRVTIRQLLTHTSGLPAGRDIWRIAQTPLEARALVLNTNLEGRPGAQYIYSDLGADVLGLIVEVVAGEPLDKFLTRRVFEPLGMNETFYRPNDSLRYRIAPTEVTPPRGYPLRGEVHDENAYALGGVAGHAGLFSTAADLSVFAQMMLNGGEYNDVRIVSDTTVALFTKRVAGSRARRPSKVISDVRADLADAAALAITDYDDGIMAMPAKFRADRAIGWNRPERAARSRSARSARSRRHVKVSRGSIAKSGSSK